MKDRPLFQNSIQMLPVEKKRILLKTHFSKEWPTASNTNNNIATTNDDNNDNDNSNNNCYYNAASLFTLCFAFYLSLVLQR
jgi:hypothetical protein